MVPNSKTIFLKAWMWSIIVALVFGVVFWIIGNFGHLFQNASSGLQFFEVGLYISIAGGYLGAGLIGWRISEKYYFTKATRFVKRYTIISILSFAISFFLFNTPLAILWSLVAPLCVVIVLSKEKPDAKSKQ